MIDTIKFRILVNDKIWEKALTLFTKSNESKQEDGSFVIHNCYFPLNLPSYDRNLNVLLYPNKSENHIFVELSLPKFIFKTNIISPTRDQYKLLIDEAYLVLSDKLGLIPPPTSWLVQRLDLAVQWRYSDLNSAGDVLNVLKQFGDTNFDTTTYKNYTTKFYLKNPEYKKHDYKWLCGFDRVYADYIDDLSKGILRFEVCLKGKAVDTCFGSYSWTSIINASDSVFENILKSKLLKFYNYLEPVMMTPEEAFKILAKNYTQEMAIKLIGYMRIRDGNNPDKKKTLSVFTPQQRSKWNRLLKLAKVGINAQTQVEMPKIDKIIVWRRENPANAGASDVSLQCETKSINFL